MSVVVPKQIEDGKYRAGWRKSMTPKILDTNMFPPIPSFRKRACKPVRNAHAS